MNDKWTLVWPEAQAWHRLPVRPSPRRQMLGACWIAVATTAGVFVADRGWETFDDDPWVGTFRMVDMLGLSGLLLTVAFAVLGWALGRGAVVSAPLVLAYAAVPHTLEHYASAWVWWAGSAAAALWALSQAGGSVRQLRAVRALARRSDTGKTAVLGEASLAAVRKAGRGSLYAALGLSGAAAVGYAVTLAVLTAELGRTVEELDGASLSDVLAAATAAALILALGQWLHCAWRAIARASVGEVIWQVPAGTGPVLRLVSQHEGQTGSLSFEQARGTPGCSCIEEFLRSESDEDEEFLENYGVPAAEYCSVHGIDQVNSLSPEQFMARVTTLWLWDPDSPEPRPARPDTDRALLVGFAGHAFTGLPARVKDGHVEIHPDGVFLLEERVAGDGEDEEADWEGPRPPMNGVLDRIDLRPAGLAGDAIRYRHGRAWFDLDTIAGASDRP